jgi:hypothetical protein
MSQNVWATILPFGPVTNFLLAQKKISGQPLSGPHFRHWPNKVETFSIYIYIYIYIWKLNQAVLELDFRAVKFFVLPSTGFEPTPLIHCSTIRLAVRPAPSTTSTPYIYIYIYICISVVYITLTQSRSWFE